MGKKTRPSKKQITEAINEYKTQIKCSLFFGVCKKTFKRWVKYHGIEIDWSKNFSTAKVGMFREIPKENDLLDCINEHKYLNLCSEVMNTTPITFKRWLSYYGLEIDWLPNRSEQIKHANTPESIVKRGKVNTKNSTIEKKCLYCGQTFKVLKSRERVSHCSIRCAYNNRETPVREIKCTNCGKLFLRNVRSIRKGRNFCCIKCRYEFVKGKSIYELYPKEKCDEWVKKAIKKCNISSVSKLSVDFFRDLDLIGDGYKYGKNEHILNVNGSVYKLDLVDIENKLCIEINGDYWHGNPLIYPSGSFINVRGKGKIPVEKLWEKDDKKHQDIKDNGFALMIIWENDIKRNRSEMLKQCKEFLRGI